MPSFGVLEGYEIANLVRLGLVSALRETHASPVQAAILDTTDGPSLAGADVEVHSPPQPGRNHPPHHPPGRQHPVMNASNETSIDSAQRIDLLLAFIKWSGLHLLQAALTALLHEQPRRSLRVLITV